MPPNPQSQFDPTLDEASLTQAITRAQQANNQSAVQELTKRLEWVRQNKQTPAAPTSDPYRDPAEIQKAITRAQQANRPEIVQELTTHLNAVNTERNKPTNYNTYLQGLPANEAQSIRSQTYIPPPSGDAGGVVRSAMGGASPYLAASALGASIGTPFGGPLGAGAGALLGPTLLGAADLGVGGVNLVSGMFGGPQFTAPSELVRSGLMSIPGSEFAIQRPTNAAERIAYGGGEFAGSALGFGGVAKQAANALNPGLAKNVLNAFAGTPVTNVMSGFGAGVAGQTARELGADAPTAFAAELAGGIAPQMLSSTVKGITRTGRVPLDTQATEAAIKARNDAYKKLDALGQRYSTVDINDILTDAAQNLPEGVYSPPPSLSAALGEISKRINAAGDVVGPGALNEMLRTFERKIATLGDPQLNLVAERLRSKIDTLIGLPEASLAGRSAKVTDLRPVIAQAQKNYADLQKMNADNVAAAMQGLPPPHNITVKDLQDARTALESASRAFERSTSSLIVRDPALKQAYDLFEGPNKDYQTAERAFSDVVNKQATTLADIQKTTADMGPAQAAVNTKSQELKALERTLARSKQGRTFASAETNAKTANDALNTATTTNKPKIDQLNTELKALNRALARQVTPKAQTATRASIAAKTNERDLLQKAIDDARTTKTNADAALSKAENDLFNSSAGQAVRAKQSEALVANRDLSNLQARQTALNDDLANLNTQYANANTNLNEKGVVYQQAKKDFDAALEAAAPTPAPGARPAMERVTRQTQAQVRQREIANEAAKRASRAKDADKVVQDVRIQTSAGVSVVDAITNSLTRLSQSPQFKNFFTEAQQKAVMDTLEGNWFASMGQRGRNIPVVGGFLGGPANVAAADRLNSLVTFLKTGQPMNKPTLTTAGVRAVAPSVAQAGAVKESEERRQARIDPAQKAEIEKMYIDADRLWKQGRWEEANAMTERANALRKQITEGQSRRQPVGAQ